MTPIVPGETVLHFSPGSGRILRVVLVVSVDGPSALVERVNGARKGERYPVGLSVLARSTNNPS